MGRTPVYEHPPEKVDGLGLRRLLTLDLVENLLFGAATVFAFLFAALVLRQGVSGWTNLAYLLGFWLVLSYLALPRLHRVLTSLYVPDYFIGRTRTSDGLLGDPVNLALTGSAEQIHEVMRAAGWIEADPVNLATSWRIVLASLTRRSYARAPVSPLLLFSRVQAFAYQQEVAGNPAQRHHVRFWPCPPGWLLPGGHRVDWLAAGSYDRAVGLSFFTLQVTHRIDRDIDIERDYIVDSIRYARPDVPVRVIEDFSTGYHSRNGGGDAVVTDGDLPVVHVEGVAVSPAPQTAAQDPGQDGRQRPDEVLQAVGRRPLSIVAAALLTLASAALTVLISAVQMPEILGEVAAESGDPQVAQALTIGLVGTLVAVAVLGLVMAWLMFLGSQWARLAMLGFLTVSQLTGLVQWLGQNRPPGSAMLSLTLDMLTIFALTSLSARTWTREHGRSARRRARRHARRLSRRLTSDRGGTHADSSA